MDLALTHLSADLDGLASLVALRRLRGPMELGVPGSLDATSARFFKDHAASLPPLRTFAELRPRLEREPLGRLWLVDTSDPARLGPLRPWVARFATVCAYDTHPRIGEGIPRAALVPAAACVSSLVLKLAEAGQTPTPEEAGLFLLGIHVDSGHFTFPGTTGADHRAAALALAWGAPLGWLSEYVPKGFTRHQLELLERMAASVEHLPLSGLDVALVSVEVGEYEPDLSVLLEQLRAAERWEVAFLLAGGGARVDVIGRSEGRLDVAGILRPLGGGGHPEAASASLRAATLSDARAILRQALREAVERGRTAAELAVRPFWSLSAGAPLREAAELLHRHRIGAVPLTRGRGSARRYEGLLLRLDVEAAVRQGLGARPAREVSFSPLRWIAPDAPLEQARALLLAGRLRLLMVGTPPRDALGILTRGTLLGVHDPELAAATKPPRPSSLRAMLERAVGERLPLLTLLGEVGQASGEPAYLVGGCVRDLLLEEPVRDLDVLVEGDARALARRAAARLGGRVHEHPAFGTARWVTASGARVDLASARSEHYPSPGALPEVSRAGLRKDLARRDFTVNALALALGPSELGRLFDPYGGLADLEAGVLRVLHGLSFHDDPTRVLRAARFAARLDFSLSEETLGLVGAARKAGAFQRVAPERLGAELQRLLNEAEVVQALRLLRDFGVLRALHPRLSGRRPFLERVGAVQGAWQRARGLGMGELQQAEPLWLVVSAALPREARTAAARLRPGGPKVRRAWGDAPERVRGVLSRLPARRRSEAARLLGNLGPAEWVYALGVARPPAAEVVWWWLAEGRRLSAAVDGRRLLALGVPRGPGVGRGLEAALAAARDGADGQAQLEAALAAARS